MTVEWCSCHSESGVPQIKSILDDDVVAENWRRTGDEFLDDEHDKDEEMDCSEGDLGEVLAGTVLYIMDKDRGAKDASTERSRCRLANGLCDDKPLFVFIHHTSLTRIVNTGLTGGTKMDHE
jgi:hypothetical protein